MVASNDITIIVIIGYELSLIQENFYYLKRVPRPFILYSFTHSAKLSSAIKIKLVNSVTWNSISVKPTIERNRSIIFLYKNVIEFTRKLSLIDWYAKVKFVLAKSDKYLKLFYSVPWKFHRSTILLIMIFLKRYRLGFSEWFQFHFCHTWSWSEKVQFVIGFSPCRRQYNWEKVHRALVYKLLYIKYETT